jgi:riboflavin kinase/FMN adenylyltransferase
MPPLFLAGESLPGLSNNKTVSGVTGMSMRILDWEDFTALGQSGDDPPDRSGALTIGVFDGVHRGHRLLIEKIVLHSRKNNSIPTVVTFRQSPRRVLSPASWHGDIYSQRQKLAVLESLGVEEAVLIDFSENFSKISGNEFVDLLKRRRKIGYLAVGANFRCGYRLDTGLDKLRELASGAGIEFEAVPQLMAGGHPVSSSRIRRAISEGNMALVSELLGRPFAIDLEGLPAGRTGDFFSWDLPAALRVAPKHGLYPVVLRQNGLAGVQAEVSVDQGRLTVKSGLFTGGIVEFI